MPEWRRSRERETHNRSKHEKVESRRESKKSRHLYDKEHKESKNRHRSRSNNRLRSSNSLERWRPDQTKSRSKSKKKHSSSKLEDWKRKESDDWGRKEDVQAVNSSLGSPLGMSSAIPLQCDKKQRELYVGNLAIGLVTADTLKEFFVSLFNALPQYHQKYSTSGPPVIHVQLSGDRKYAFVEMRDEILAATAIKFNKTTLCGRALNIGRPSGYVPGLHQPPSMDISPLVIEGIVPTIGGGSVAIANKKQREVYVGNLPVGMVTPQMIRELFTKPMTILPEYDPLLGAPVLNVDLGADGRYAFVEFQSERLAIAALNTFQNLQLYGRQLSLGRPTGCINASGGAMGVNGYPAMSMMAPVSMLPPLNVNFPVSSCVVQNSDYPSVDESDK